MRFRAGLTAVSAPPLTGVSAPPVHEVRLRRARQPRLPSGLRWHLQPGPGQAAVFRTQVGTVCGEGDALLEAATPEQAFTAWMRSLNAYLVTKRGLSHALIEAVGIESELMSSCWMAMRETTERLLTNGQQAGAIRSDVSATDVMRLVHGVAVSTERAPDRADTLLSVMIDGLRVRP